MAMMLSRWSRRVIVVLAAALGCTATALESAPGARLNAALSAVFSPSADVRRDLDGDGVVDESRVSGPDRVSVQLSSTSALVTLPTANRVIGLASVDIDRDGDLDLVAFLEDGGSVVWINDGHGVFAQAARRSTAPTPGVVSAQRWIAGIPFAPLGLSGWHHAWLARPPSFVIPERTHERPVAETSTPLRRLARFQPDRAPPFTSL